MLQEYLWTEVYRPHTVDEIILPYDIKNIFKKFIEQKNIPNLILSGPSGTGKTTVAISALKELGCDYLFINASLNGNVDTLRYEIQNFASSVSMFGNGRKYVILDEADGLNPLSTQPSLRSFMEQYSKNCGFILTCNLKDKIIPALHSRCSLVEFKINKKDSAKLASEFLKRVLKILEKEKVEYDTASVAAVIAKFYPDWRKVLSTLQFYAASGKIDSGILSAIDDLSISDLVNLVKSKNFTAIRKWIGENLGSDQNLMFRRFYDTASSLVEPSSIPVLILLIGKYQYQAAFSVDQEINFSAFLVEVMAECVFL